MPASITPTGIEQEFGDDELFFSTTDRRGIIDLANSTFVRLSRFPHETLHGAPHNIIRHPDMPGGAFSLMWRQIEKGLPACVYVDNLAADGSRYRVLATVVPLGDDYLSVRMRPRNGATVDASFDLYRGAADIERQARAGGISKRDAAELGAAHIATGLANMGIEGLDEFASIVLPAELAAHDVRSEGLPERPGATGPAADALAAIHVLDAKTKSVLPFLDELAAVSEELSATWPRITPGLVSLREAAALAVQKVEGLDEQAADDTAYYGEQIADRVRSADAAVHEIPGRLTHVRGVVARTRTRIALMHLHALMVGRYAAEMIDGDVVGDAHAALSALARALDDGASILSDDLADLTCELGDVGEGLRAAVSEIDRLRRPLFRWQASLEEAGRSDLASRIPSEVAGLDEMSDLGGRCRLLTLPFDLDEVREAIARVREA